jgi:tetratricopeptide (TPR) repeat protein
LLLSEGLMHLDLDNFARATDCFRLLLSIRPEAHFASVIDGLYSYQANHHVGLGLARQGRFAEAESCWRLALPENPCFLLSWRALADLYSQHGRWQELWDVIGELERLGEEPVDLVRLHQALPAGWRPGLRSEMGHC